MHVVYVEPTCCNLLHRKKSFQILLRAELFYVVVPIEPGGIGDGKLPPSLFIVADARPGTAIAGGI